MWFRRKAKNRRLSQTRVLDVKVRSSRVRAARIRLATIATSVALGTLLGVYLAWRAGTWALDRFVYENKSFAIQRIDVVTDGVISADQLRRWSGVKVGENLLAIDLARVKRNLELVAMIQSASIERLLPNTLRIRVTEREPVAQVNVPHLRDGGGIELVVFQIDTDGYVMVPLDPRQRAVPLSQAEDQLPVISGINLSELQPGRKVESPQTAAALRLIASFESSPMAGLVDLKRVDVSSPEVLVATTGQGSEVTLGLDDFDRQLLRWKAIHELGLSLNRVIATLDLAIPNNIPTRWAEAGSVPPAAPKSTPPARTRRRHV